MGNNLCRVKQHDMTCKISEQCNYLSTSMCPGIAVDWYCTFKINIMITAPFLLCCIKSYLALFLVQGKRPIAPKDDGPLEVS